MSPFRRKSDLGTGADEPVFIDLGLATLHDVDERTRIRVVVADEEKDLRPIKRWVSSGAVVVADLSSLSGDIQVAEAIIRDAGESTEGVVRKVGTDSWIVVPGNIVVEVPRK